VPSKPIQHRERRLEQPRSSASSPPWPAPSTFLTRSHSPSELTIVGPRIREFIAATRSGDPRGARSNVNPSLDDCPDVATIGRWTVGTLTSLGFNSTARLLLGGSTILTADRQVRLLRTRRTPGSWPMFQANARHQATSGSASIRQDSPPLAGGRGGDQPGAAGGKVFVTTRTRCSHFGPTTAARSVGDLPTANSVNPRVAYGNARADRQHATDTWPRLRRREWRGRLKVPHYASGEFLRRPSSASVKAAAAILRSGTSSGSPTYPRWTPAPIRVPAGPRAAPLNWRHRLRRDPVRRNGWSMNLALSW
jgi:hypothetical protein